MRSCLMCSMGGNMRLSLLIIVCFSLCMTLPQTSFAVAEYVGSKKCSECHLALYSDWRESGHHLQLRKAENAQHTSLPLPPGYSWDDLSYVIGGNKKKAQFVDLNGYIITSAKDGSKDKTQYHLEDGTWSYYLPGEKKTYDCAGCHTTGYKPAGHQDGREGIVGTWEEDGIGCEACHGPGSTHIKDPPGKLKSSKRLVEACTKCHQHGGIDYRPLNDLGLVRHQEQLNELIDGLHKGLTCINCHNPHRRAVHTKYNCTICHSSHYGYFKDSTHGKAGIKCFECHMPKVSSPMIERASYIGDVRKHLFKINTDPEADMFKIVEEKGYQSNFAKGFVTVEFACLSCHGNRDKAWAARHAIGFHK